MNGSHFFRRFLLAIFSSLCVLGAASAAQAQGQKAPTLSSLKFEFDVQRAELMKPIRGLQKNYEKQLNQLLDQVTEAGNLEKALAAKAELEGFKSDESKPADAGFPELKRLQGIYAGEFAKRTKAMSKKLGSVIEDHKEKLLVLQTRLTKDRKLDEALLVKAEIAKVDQLAEAGEIETEGPPEPAGNLRTTGTTLVQAAKSVRAKGGVEEPAENVIAFDAPSGDGRSGAKGILVKSEGGASEGSTWMFHYTRTASSFELQIIHPRGKGQAIIHIRPLGIGISTPGEWLNSGYGGGDNDSVRTRDAFEDIFPLENDREYVIASRMDGNGSCEVFVDGKLVATARARSAKPLVLEIPEGMPFPGSGRGKLEFTGEGLPLEWQEGWAGVLLGPLDGGTHLCSDVRYCAGVADVSD